MKILPKAFRLELSRQMPVGKWDLAKLLEVFSIELASREQCQSIKFSEPSSQITGSQDLNSGYTFFFYLRTSKLEKSMQCS